MKFLYTTIIYCDCIYPRHYPPFFPVPLISSFLSITPFPTLCPSIFGDPKAYVGLLLQEPGSGVIYRSIDNLAIATPLKRMSPLCLDLGQAAQLPLRLPRG